MKIRYREAGGFTGLSRGVDIDTASLPEDEAQRVLSLVERAGLVSQDEPAPGDARDLRGYELVIEVEARLTVVRFDDATAPPTADELLAYLQGRARPMPLRPAEDP
jgi:hypothetical protein